MGLHRELHGREGTSNCAYKTNIAAARAPSPMPMLAVSAAPAPVDEVLPDALAVLLALDPPVVVASVALVLPADVDDRVWEIKVVLRGREVPVPELEAPVRMAVTETLVVVAFAVGLGESVVRGTVVLPATATTVVEAEEPPVTVKRPESRMS